MLRDGRFARWVGVRLEVAPTNRVTCVGSRNAETQSTQREAGSHQAMKPGLRSPFLASWSPVPLPPSSTLAPSAPLRFLSSSRASDPSRVWVEVRLDVAATKKDVRVLQRKPGTCTVPFPATEVAGPMGLAASYPALIWPARSGAVAGIVRLRAGLCPARRRAVRESKCRRGPSLARPASSCGRGVPGWRTGSGSRRSRE